MYYLSGENTVSVVLIHKRMSFHVLVFTIGRDDKYYV